MAKHEHEHEQHHQQAHGHQHGHGHEHHGHKRKGLHKDWRMWVVVVLMLAGMAMYIMSMDESIQPGNPVQGQPMPIAPAPPAGV